jgi:hypothetical protein
MMRGVLIAVGIIALLVVVALATGFLNLSGDAGKLPEVAVEGGRAPSVDADVGEVVVGTKEETIKVPDVDVSTKAETIDVPVVGVKKANEE